METDGDVLVFDLETKRTFDEVGGNNYGLLGVSVLGYYSYQQDRYECLLESELNQFENAIIDAQLIIGYNSNKFDLPVLQPYLSLDVSKLPSLDLLEEINKVLGFRVSLDSVGQATLGVGKTGHGLDAIQYYRQGQLEKLKAYCLNDVKVTKLVYDYGVKHGEVAYLGRDKVTRKLVEANWKNFQTKDQAQEKMQQYRLLF